MAVVGHPVFEVIIDQLDVAGDEVILDLGCGDGPGLHALARRFPTARLIGLDQDQISLDRASSLLTTTGADRTTRSNDSRTGTSGTSTSTSATHTDTTASISSSISTPGTVAPSSTFIDAARVDLRLADLAAPLPLEDAGVDATICHNVLECLPDPLALLDETARVLRPGGTAVWSHVDFDSFIISGPARALTRRVLHAHADHQPTWLDHFDAHLGRRLPALVRASALDYVDVTTHQVVAAELAGLAMARVDEIASALRAGGPDITADEVADWRTQIDVAAEQGRFLFAETAFVVTSTRTADDARTTG